MAQSRKKQSHPSDAWTVKEKRRSLEMMLLASRPHVRVFLPSLDELPLIGYMTPQDFCLASQTKLLNPSPFSGEVVDPQLAAWAAANDNVCPAIRFKVNGRVDGAKYISRMAPEFSFGLLNIETVRNWVCVPNIQRLWLASAWAFANCNADDWVSDMYKKVNGRPLKTDFTSIKWRVDTLPNQLKIFLAITFLNPFWRKANYLAVGVGHLVQLQIVSQMGTNNFRNYLGESGARSMSASQVERQWAKFVNASTKLEKFQREQNAKRKLAVNKFLQENYRSPLVSDIWSLLDS